MNNIYGSYQNARNASWQVLIDYKIVSLPVSVIKIAAACGIDIYKNSDVKELRPGEVGASIFDAGKWYIVYDDTVTKGRIRFTIAHELGHILLGHPLVNGYHARTIDTSKPQIETEADVFASRLLSPACVLWGLDIHSAEDIKNICNISRSAAEIRAERMAILYKRNKFLISPLERQVYEQFKNYINERRDSK